MFTKTFRKYSAADHLCPCGKSPREEVERVSRGLFIKTFLFWLPVRRYKCYKCRRKRWVLG
jgi:hypothetical protein